MPTSTLKISIITASFQSGSTIQDTLESVNEQTHPFVEHIIIDGNSSDETLEKVKKYGNRVSNVVSESDKGIFDAYNKGLKIADGDIIGILNSDDYYTSAYVLEHVAQIFETEDVDAVYADLIYVDEINTARVVRYWKSKKVELLNLSCGFIPPHPTLFLRREVYGRVGNFNPNYRFSGDFEFMLRVFEIHKVHSFYLDETIIKMRTGGATGGNLVSIKDQNIEILRAFKENKVEVVKYLYFTCKAINRIKQRLRAFLCML